MPRGKGGGASSSSSGGGGGPTWSQGHGTSHEDGKTGVRAKKTVLVKSGAESVSENWGKRVIGGRVKGGSGDTEISFVPTRRNPLEHRAVGTKVNHGTTHPLGLDPKALALAGNLTIVDRPDSPRPVKPLSPPVGTPPLSSAVSSNGLLPPVSTSPRGGNGGGHLPPLSG